MIKISINLFLLFFIVFGISSCKDNAVTTSKAETVSTITTAKTILYNTIKPGSFLDWRASHLGGVDPRLGKIYFKDATILVNDGKVSNIDILIDMPSLTVENLSEDSAYDLSEHLKHEDFFNIAKHPTSKFELTRTETQKGLFNSKVTGNLEILGVTRSITFNANISVSKSEVSIKSEDFIIDRSDWGMTYNAEGTTGVPLDYLISDDVGFTIDFTVLK